MESTTTMALIKGLDNMLKNRGSMTVEEVQLLEEVIAHLREHDSFQGQQKITNGVLITELLMRFLLDPELSRSLTHLSAHLLDKLL